MLVPPAFLAEVPAAQSSISVSAGAVPTRSTPLDRLLQQCEPFSGLFVEAGRPLEYVQSEADLAWAIELVLRLDRLGITRHLLSMVRRAADSNTPLVDRLALRAVLDGDEERAARIWRAAGV